MTQVDTRTNIVICGIPASGKTTYRNKLIKNSEYLVLSTDDYLENLDLDYNTAFHSHYRDAEKHMNKKLNEHDWNCPIIWDQTNTTLKKRNSILRKLESLKSPFETEFHLLNTPIEECILRNSKRESSRKVPEKILISMFENLNNSDLKGVKIVK